MCPITAEPGITGGGGTITSKGFFQFPLNSDSAFTKEFQHDKVIFHGSWLWAGTHTVSYVAVVASEGTFVLPPAKAYDPTQPELMGLSAGGKFTSASLPQGVPVQSTYVILFFFRE